jgi:tRNA-(ms[2]io[6]A)-hydroxylase
MSAHPVSPALANPLRAATDERWFETACERWRELLIDHANCEKKAASTALSLMFTYADDVDLSSRLSRLAREELRHFEQVQKYMLTVGVPYQRLTPSRYAEGLRRAVRRDEPGRKLDLLLCATLIEARSCERFVGLVPRLHEPLASFYRGLAESESRHQSLYLWMAERRSDPVELEQRLAAFADIEAELATSPDSQFRFHSGTPV